LGRRYNVRCAIVEVYVPEKKRKLLHGVDYSAILPWNAIQVLFEAPTIAAATRMTYKTSRMSAATRNAFLDRMEKTAVANKDLLAEVPHDHPLFPVYAYISCYEEDREILDRYADQILAKRR
jgi:hypothetical protein